MEVKYRSIFKNELKNFLLSEKISIKKTHQKDIKDLDNYFYKMNKKEKTITSNDYYNYINNYNSTINQKRRYGIILKFSKYLDNLNYESIFYENISLNEITNFKVTIYEDKDIKKILKRIDKRVSNKEIHPCYSVIFRLYISSGLRPSEPLKIRACDVNLDKNYIDIIESKGNKSRRIFLSNSMNEVLKKYINLIKLTNGENIFPVKRGDVMKILEDALNICNIPYHTKRLHDFRHTFAVNALDKMLYKLHMTEETALEYLRIYMGHNNLEATEQYLHFTKKMKDEIRYATQLFYKKTKGGSDEQF